MQFSVNWLLCAAEVTIIICPYLYSFYIALIKQYLLLTIVIKHFLRIRFCTFCPTLKFSLFRICLLHLVKNEQKTSSALLFWHLKQVNADTNNSNATQVMK